MFMYGRNVWSVIMSYVEGYCLISCMITELDSFEGKCVCILLCLFKELIFECVFLSRQVCVFKTVHDIVGPSKANVCLSDVCTGASDGRASYFL